MLKNRSLMYGLGFGLIIGAALLQLMNAASTGREGVSAPETAPTAVQQLDKEQLKSAASKHFQVFEKDQKVYTQAEAENLIQQKVNEEKAKQPAQAATPVRETYVYISKGMSASQVAESLYQSGVITDRKSFEDQMISQQLTGRIVSGVHAFKGPAPMDQTQVISNITTP
jgi:hypothetical protein